MKQTWRKTNPSAVSLLLALIICSSSTMCLGSQPEWIFVLKVPPPLQLLRELVQISEVSELDKVIPGGIEGLLTKELPPEVGELRDLTVAWGFDEKGEKKWAIFEDTKPVVDSDNPNYGISLMDRLIRSKSEPGNSSLNASKAALTFPVFPPEIKGKICGWISPVKLAENLKSAILREGELELKQRIDDCQSNCRKILKIILKESKAQKKDIVTGPLTRKDAPTCPFAGHYSLMAQSSMAASSQNAPAAAYKVLCDHKPPPSVTFDSVPENGLVKVMKPVFEKLRNFPDIKIGLNESEKSLAIEVSSSRKPNGKLLQNFAEIEKDGESLDLEWVSAAELKIPVTEKFPMVLFLGFNPWNLFSRMGHLSNEKDLKNTFKTGVVALLTGRFDPEALFSRGVGEIPVAIGVPDENGKVFSFLSEEFSRAGLKKGTLEEQGVELPALIPQTLGERNKLEIASVDIPPYRFFSGSGEVTRALLRSMNGEDRCLKILQNIGEKVKYFLAIRMDHLGRSVAKLVGLVLFEKETHQCRKNRTDFLSSSKQETDLTHVSAEVSEKCPRGGLMIMEKRLICAVHDRRIFLEGRNPAEPEVDFPKDRWLLVALVKKGEKTILEARIVRTGEEIK